MTTGLSLASTIANLYLALEFDPHVMNFEGIDRAAYRRYIDDAVGKASTRVVHAELFFSDRSTDGMIHCQLKSQNCACR